MDEDRGNCEVCGKPVLCGSRHHQCGTRLREAGFDLANDLDRPDPECDCAKCKAFYSNGVLGTVEASDETRNNTGENHA